MHSKESMLASVKEGVTEVRDHVMFWLMLHRWLLTNLLTARTEQFSLRVKDAKMPVFTVKLCFLFPSTVISEYLVEFYSPHC